MSQVTDTDDLKVEQVEVFFELFPFDGCWWFGCEVVEDSVNAIYFVDDAVGDGFEEFKGERESLGGHGVFAGYSAQNDGLLVGSFITHDADTADIEECGVGLPDAFVEARFEELFAENPVGFLSDFDSLTCHFTEDPDAESGAGEGFAVNDFGREAKGATDFADFIFKEPAEWFDDFELHPVGQATDVVVGFNFARGGEPDSMTSG